MRERHSSIDDREMPPEVAAQFEIALGLDETPETLGDWVDATATRLAAADVALGVDEMCLTASSRHRARIGGSVEHFACVLDTLLLPFVLDDAGVSWVSSQSPVSGAPVEFRVGRDGISAAPADAVVSFGVEAETPPPDERDGVLAYGTAVFCPYINAFHDPDEYDEWADETQAVTMALPLTEGFAVAKRFGRRLTE